MSANQQDLMDAPDASARMGRRQFLRVGAAAGGGLVASFAIPGWAAEGPVPAEAAVGKAAAVATEDAAGFAPNGFVRIDRSGGVTFTIHKVEMGQGTFTSLPMLLAEELEVDLATVKLLQAPPDGQRYSDPLLGGQVTGGSTSIRACYGPMRTAGATVRTMLVSAAAQGWNVDPSTCVVRGGLVIHAPSGRKLSYGQLADAAAKLPVPKDVKLKDAKDFRLVGKKQPRLDSLDKIRGRTTFGIDIRLKGMRYATVAASPVVGGTLASVDEAKAMAVKGVRQVVKLDNAVAVVGDHMWACKQGLAALAPTWTDGPNADFNSEALRQQMDSASMADGAVARSDGDALKAVVDAGDNKIEAVYQLPFLAHAPMEPINITVDLKKDSCDLWVGTQVPTFAQGAASKISGLPLDKVSVHNQYIGGGFGRRLEVDSVVQAMQFAKQIEGPVKFVWTREEDVQHDMYRPYYYDRLSAVLDEKGNPSAWTHKVTGSSIMSRFAPAAVVNGVDSDAVEGAKDVPYAIPNVHVSYVRHEPPVPTAFWRGVGPTHNIFVVESFIDELAAKAGKDPLQYRLALLDKQPRHKAVLQMAADKAGWSKPMKAAPAGSKSGRGLSVQFAFGTYMAQVVEVTVNKDGDIKVDRVVCALDCGQIVNPDTVEAQIQGGVIFGLSAALWGEITYDKGRVQQSNFHDYRVMRLGETPTIEVYTVASTEKPGGLGEPGTAAVFAALANAVHAATGTRVRRLPIRLDGLKNA